jgi:hypothetical protein
MIAVKLRLLLSLRRGRRFLAPARYISFPAVSSAVRCQSRRPCMGLKPCHTTVYNTNADSEARLVVAGDEPPSPLTAASLCSVPTAHLPHGRDGHALTTYEAFTTISPMTSSTFDSSTPSTTSWARTADSRYRRGRMGAMFWNICKNLPARFTGVRRRTGIRRDLRQGDQTFRNGGFDARTADSPQACSCTWRESSSPSSRARRVQKHADMAFGPPATDSPHTRLYYAIQSIC